MHEMAQLYIDMAKAYGHSAIFVHPNPGGLENTQWLLELIREKSGDEYYIMIHGDPTWAIPDGDEMMEFSRRMYEEPQKMNEESRIRVEQALEFASDRTCKMPEPRKVPAFIIETSSLNSGTV